MLLQIAGRGHRAYSGSRGTTGVRSRAFFIFPFQEEKKRERREERWQCGGQQAGVDVDVDVEEAGVDVGVGVADGVPYWTETSLG